MSLIIPELPADLVVPVRTLALTASLFRGVFVEVAGGRPLSEILNGREQSLLDAEHVLDLWLSHLKLEEAQTEEEAGGDQTG
jgi:hypothetical protein